MWSVDFYLTGKKNENKLFQVPSITESEIYGFLSKDKKFKTVFFE